MRLPLYREQSKPNLLADGYDVKSIETWDYNCIGFAAGDEHNWWWPDPDGDGFWPIQERDETLDCFERAFRTLGFLRCSDPSLEPGFEKVAVYVDKGIPTHAAKQLPNGKWKSKLGPWEDIEHNSLFGLEGDEPAYGKPALYMRKPIIV